MAIWENILVPRGVKEGQEWGIWVCMWRVLAIWYKACFNSIRGEGEHAELFHMLLQSFYEGK